MLNEKLPQYWNVKTQSWTNDESSVAVEFNMIFKERSELSRDLHDVLSSSKTINRIGEKYATISVVNVADISNKLQDSINDCTYRLQKLAY